MKKESVTAWRRTPRRDMEFRRLQSAPFKTGLHRKKAKQTLIDQVDVYFLGVIYFLHTKWRIKSLFYQCFVTTGRIIFVKQTAIEWVSR